MTGKPIFKEVLQVAMVVRNLDEALKRYWEICGIGPWEIHTMSPANMHGMTVRGHETECAMKVAFTNLGNVQLELIEPLDGRSIYADFLKEHGLDYFGKKKSSDLWEVFIHRNIMHGLLPPQAGICRMQLVNVSSGKTCSSG